MSPSRIPLLTGFVGLIVGLLAGWLLSRRDGWRVALSGAILGLLLGLLIGMSQSPLVAAAVTAAFGLTGTLIGKLQDRGTGADPAVVLRPAWPSLAIPDWVLGFSTGCILGIVLGVTVRVNDLLSFRDARLSTQLVRLGFDANQVEAIMARLSQQITLEQVAPGASDLGSFLHSRESITTLTAGSNTSAEKSFDWALMWRRFDEGKLTDAEVLATLRETAPRSIRDIIDIMKKRDLSDVTIVNRLRDITQVHP